MTKAMRERLVTYASLAIGVPLGIGCGDVDSSDPPVAVHSIAEAVVVREPVIADPPTRITDKRGRAWRRNRKVDYVPDPPANTSRERHSAANRVAPPNLEKLSDAELAEKIRPISLYAGYEYSLEEAPIEQARELKASALRQAMGELETTGGEPSETTVGVAEEELTGQSIIGGDGRVKKRDNLAYPWRSIMLMTNSNMTSLCSAQLIGPSTATSAAHCFNSGIGWYSPRRWGTGIDSQDANPFPDGLFDGCYWVTVPSAFANDDEIYYDFAVVEFSDMFPTCNLFPGSWAGYLGFKHDYTPSSSITGYVYGFPGVTCPGAATCNWPQIWGIGTNGMDEDTDNIDHYADTTTGSSGAGLYVIVNGNRYLIGNHWGGYDSWNEARRLQGLFYAYLTSYTAL